jgi:hypothetical protein
MLRSRHLMRASAVAGAAFALALATRASAAGDDVTGLVAGASKLFARRGNAVVTFDGAGREIARCARFAAPPPRPIPRAGGPIDAQEVLRLAGLPDDDFQSADAEDVLAREGLVGLVPRRKRPTPAEGPILVRALAASAASDDVWIATTGGLYRGRDGACTPAALPGREVVAVAVAGSAIAVATPDLLWRSTDGGGTFRVAAGLTARPRALAIVDTARTLVANDDGVIEVGPHGTVRAVLERGSDALAVCGGMAMAFVGGDTWTWSGGAPERAGDRPFARTLGCGNGQAARFVAAGDRLFLSSDGATWRERLLPGPSAGAAAVGDRLWLAAGSRVVALDRAPTPDPPPAAAAPRAPALSPLPTRRLVEPMFPWPQLTIVFSAQRAPLRDGWSLVALVVFRLGRGAGARADALGLATELARRDAALAAQEIELVTATDDDPTRTARLRALRQEREALR